MRRRSSSCRRSVQTHGLTIHGRRVPYGSGVLPEDFVRRLTLLKEASGLTWNGFAESLGVDPKQVLRGRHGTEPCGGAMLTESPTDYGRDHSIDTDSIPVVSRSRPLPGLGVGSLAPAPRSPANVCRGPCDVAPSLWHWWSAPKGRRRAASLQHQLERQDEGSRFCPVWWSWGDSNPLPFDCQSNALPIELQPHAGTAIVAGPLLSVPPHSEAPTERRGPRTGHGKASSTRVH